MKFSFVLKFLKLFSSWSPGVERIVDKEFADRYDTEKHSPEPVTNDLKIKEVDNCEKAVLDEDSKVKGK